jgi:hypothetical protein
MLLWIFGLRHRHGSHRTGKPTGGFLRARRVRGNEHLPRFDWAHRGGHRNRPPRNRKLDRCRPNRAWRCCGWRLGRFSDDAGNTCAGTSLFRNTIGASGSSDRAACRRSDRSSPVHRCCARARRVTQSNRGPRLGRWLVCSHHLGPAAAPTEGAAKQEQIDPSRTPHSRRSGLRHSLKAIGWLLIVAAALQRLRSATCSAHPFWMRRWLLASDPQSAPSACLPVPLWLVLSPR